MIELSDTKLDLVYTGFFREAYDWWEGEDVDIEYAKLGYDERNRIVKMNLYNNQKSIGWFE